jgi:hypothetical protein
MHICLWNKILKVDVLQQTVLSYLEPLPRHLLGDTCTFFRGICLEAEQDRMVQLLGERVAEIASLVAVEECPRCLTEEEDPVRYGGTARCRCCLSVLLGPTLPLSSLTLPKLFPSGGRFNSKGEPQVMLLMYSCVSMRRTSVPFQGALHPVQVVISGSLPLQVCTL